VAGFTEPGPVVPRHPPRTFEQIMKYLLVSNRLARPDHAVPPARLALLMADAGRMGVA